MMIKYKLSEVAKVFGLSNKEISEILGKYLKAPKSNAQASMKKSWTLFLRA